MDHTLIAPFGQRYLDALVAGDEGAADSCIRDALARGIGPALLYLEVLAPAQVAVGERWHRGLLSVAAEHAATQITRNQMARLMSASSRSAVGAPRAVVSCVQDEQHELGARMVADFFLMDGWGVDFLGAATPTEDLVAFVESRVPDVVVLSVTIADYLDHARNVVRDLRALPRAPRVLLGGQAVRARRQEAEAVDADAISADAWDAVQQARSWLSTSPGPSNLDGLLHGLGGRIREARRARGWSQQRLADGAGLDRSYVNAVEQGKQNLTLGAVLKLADALGRPPGQLLFGMGEEQRRIAF